MSEDKSGGCRVKVDYAPPNNPTRPTIDVIAIHGIHGSYRTTWCTPEADSRGFGPLLSKLSSFCRILAYDVNIQETILFEKSGLEKAATDLLKSINTQTGKKRPIVFLCHDVSTILIKELLWIANHDKTYINIALAIRGLICFDAPDTSHGYSWNDILSKLLPATTEANSHENIPVTRTELKECAERQSSIFKAVSARYDMISNQYMMKSFYSRLLEINNLNDIMKLVTEWTEEIREAYQSDAVACRQCLASLHEQDGSPGEMCAIPLNVTDCFLNSEQLDIEPGITTIFGRAGSGKSVLASQISKTLAFNTDKSILLSYYFSKSDYRRRSYLNLLLSFILQMLYRGDASFDSAYVRRLHSLMPSPEEITSSDLYRLLSGMLNRLSEFNVIIVIDAIDECGEDSRLQLVGDLQRLVLGSPTRYKIFITHRPSEDILRVLGTSKESNKINLDEGFDAKKSLLLNRELDGDDLADLRQRLANENATPLVIGLASALRRTMGTNTIDTNTKINIADYNAVYEHMLKEIDAPYAWLREVLLCVAFAKRPLTVNELAGAMWIAPSSSNILGNEKLTLQKMLIAAPTYLKTDLEVACGPLLRVVNGVVSFVHGTLRDFVRERSDTLLQNKAPQGERGKPDFNMLQKCLKILSTPELRKMDGFTSKRRPFDTLSDSPIVFQPHIFTLYADSCLSLHMGEDAEYFRDDDKDGPASAMTEIISPFLYGQDGRFLDSQVLIKPIIVESAAKLEFEKVGCSNLRLFASIGARPIIKLLLLEIGNDQEKVELALWDALRHGHAGATELLLLKSAESNTDIWQTALEKCCRYGRAELARLVISLWSKTFDFKPSEDNLYRCLDEIAKHGHWHVIPRMQKAFSSSVDSITRERLVDLITAAANQGWDGVVNELLSIDLRTHKSNDLVSSSTPTGGDPEEDKVDEDGSQNGTNGVAAEDDKDFWLSNALVEGSIFGSTAVVQLLQPYADLQYTTEWLKFTALHHAALEDRFEVLEQLLDQGADIEYKDGQDATPLLLACLRENTKTVQVLLNRGANPDHVAVASARYRALHIAARNGNGFLVRILLEAGASEDARVASPDGYTPLHFAVSNSQGYSQYLEAARILLEFGADVNATNDRGRTPLHIAICSEDQDDPMVQLLLNFGADIGMRDENSQSASHDPDTLSAYWRAIRNDKPTIVEFLLQNNPWLINEKSDGGFNGLETYLRADRSRYDDGKLSGLFVQLGLDPFKQEQGDQLSCFQLGILSRRKLSIAFLEACVKCIPSDTASCNIGLKDLRIATEINELDLWTKLAPFKAKIENEVDQDDWNIHHFLYQAKPRKDYAEYEEAALRKTKTPTALVWPQIWQQWSKNAAPHIEADGLEAYFESEPYERGNAAAITIRANFPFPPRELDESYSYFELTILESVQSENAGRVIFAIGLTGEFTNQVQALPGWNIWSIGYHSDDGGIFENESSRRATTKTYGTGQTVGCGIDYERNEYFFTCDGEIVFRKSSTLIFRKLYPCIGHKAEAGRVRVNFGKENFKWQKANKAL
ncbi:Protein SSH4 [Trichoderma simmonsii]|uniref:Protein SSH4 n=1 Tax=Trichoderma simmonsii TaxID=1491479 RepID=A0A8G0LJ25_9HYPO|nr:Protein SSH4 [Trichoderma simmonsii]